TLRVPSIFMYISFFFFFFNDTATTEIYTLSLHDALPISYVEERQAIALCRVDRYRLSGRRIHVALVEILVAVQIAAQNQVVGPRSEEHTSELQSRPDLVCRLLLEKKKTKNQK